VKVLIGQINTTPGDFSGNTAKILAGLETIKPSDHVKMAIFPELSICGYLSRDLLYETHYIDRNLLALHTIVNASFNYRDVAIVVGYVDRNKSGSGKHFANMLAVIRNGTILGTYQKHLLPFYDVFDEGRYYEPGTQLLILPIDGVKVGFTICEDVWNDKGSDDYNYLDNPIQSYRKLGIDHIVNISSSPFAHGKPNYRLKMLREVCTNMTMIYVNQIGGQDDLVFDGHSCIISRTGIAGIVDPPKDPSITAQYEILDTDHRAYVTSDVQDGAEDFRIKYIHKMIISGLYDYVIKSGFTRVVLGSSGGIDSAVIAALACEAFGPENVHCIMMPSIYSSEGSVKDAKALHNNLNCVDYKLPIEHEKLVDKFQNSFEFTTYNKSADENIQARMRGMAVMYFSNALGALALTTGNKTELATGYCTLYGDMNGGFAPISDLYKMEVFALAKYINKKAKKIIIPEEIINKAPSAELAPGQTDEASLLPYPILDNIVSSYVEDYIDTFEGLCEVYLNKHPEYSHMQVWIATPKAKDDFYRIVRLININEFKRRQAAPGIKLCKVAFGSGRRLPIVKKMRM
jgi:NAD+ synthase (glutamine-hydrolysing)